MERQEHLIGSFQIIPNLSICWVVLAVLLFVQMAYSYCITSSNRYDLPFEGCSYGSTCGADRKICSTQSMQCRQIQSDCPNPLIEGSYRWILDRFQQSSDCSATSAGCTASGGASSRCFYRLACTTKCEADSIICISSGNAWDSEHCQCDNCSCDELQSNCESLNGTFEGNCANADPNGGKCCIGTCFLCNTEASQKQQEMAKRVCCASGMVPPKLSDYCFDVPPPGKCGMNYSNVRNDFDSQWKCRELDENSSSEMIAWYREACLNSSSSAAESSPSSGASSSGDGGSSSSGSPYPDDCPECPWLDSILDTLTAQKWLVGEIQTCILNPSLCGSVDGEQPQIDTSLLPYIRPFMDSTVKLSREQIELLAHLDTNMLKILDSLSNIPKSDTAVMMAINGASSTIDGKLSIVNQSVVNMNDSNKKWLRRIADSLRVINDTNKKYLENVAEKIGISTDSLLKHIDSVKNRIPTDILDSILKYQKLSSESSDSVTVDVDLSSIDSLIDSTISYWNRSLRADSLRGEKMNDSLGAIHDAIEGISYTMYQLLGYGDTASKTLRNDIEGIESAVNEYRDSALKYYASFGDSTISYWNRSLRADSLRGEKMNDSLGAIHDAIEGISYTMYQLLGYGDTASKTLRNDIEGIENAIDEYRDSALKYYASFGDSMGALNGSLGALIAKFSPGAVDTTGLGVWASYVRNGENMGDSIVNSYGWQNFKNLNVDSNYNAALLGISNKTDSLSGVVDDSLSNRAARLNDSLVRKNDSLKRNLPDTLTKYADSLVIWAPFADFDSIIYSTIGTRIPNRDECPEDCQKWSVSIPVIGLVNYTVDYGLCLGRASLGNLSVLAFLKLLIRIIVAITCVMIIYRTLIGLK